jgi:flagellar biogenesis protein FliO
MGDLLFQLFSMLLMVGFVTVFIYILVNFLNRSKKPSSTAVEEKLDRIIELLESERKKD